MKKLIKDVVKGFAVAFLVGAALALSAPPLASALNITAELGLSANPLWLGSFFGLWGGFAPIATAVVNKIAGEKTKDDVVASSTEKLQETQASAEPSLENLVEVAEEKPSRFNAWSILRKAAKAAAVFAGVGLAIALSAPWVAKVFDIPLSNLGEFANPKLMTSGFAALASLPEFIKPVVNFIWGGTAKADADGEAKARSPVQVTINIHQAPAVSQEMALQKHWENQIAAERMTIVQALQR